MAYKVIAVAALIMLLSLFVALVVGELIQTGNDLGEED
jgi:hypothetical protein